MKYFPKYDHVYDLRHDFGFDQRYIDNPRGMTFPHYHEDWEIYFLVSGNRKYFVENKIFTLQPNQILIFKPNVVHQVTVNLNIPYERYLLYVTPRLFSGIINEIRLQKANMNTQFFNLSPEDFQTALSYFSNLKEEIERDDRFSASRIKNIISDLLIYIFRHNDTSNMELSSVDSRIQSAIDFILENFTEQITLEDAANVACLAPFYFSKVFHNTTALTFKEFLNKVRIDKACELLETTDDRVSDITQAVGFNTESYFAAAFRTINGVSPSQYRKIHQK